MMEQKQEREQLQQEEMAYGTLQTMKEILQVYIFDNCEAITLEAYERFVGSAEGTQIIDYGNEKLVAVSAEMVQDILARNPNLEPRYIDARTIENTNDQMVKDQLNRNQFPEYSDRDILQDHDKINQYTEAPANNIKNFEAYVTEDMTNNLKTR